MLERRFKETDDPDAPDDHCAIGGPDCCGSEGGGTSPCEECGRPGCATCVPDEDEHVFPLLCLDCRIRTGAECDPEIQVEVDALGELAKYEAAAAEAFEALFLEAEEDPGELGRVLICRLATGDAPDALRDAFVYAVGADVDATPPAPEADERKTWWRLQYRPPGSAWHDDREFRDLDSAQAALKAAEADTHLADHRLVELTQRVLRREVEL